MPYETSKWPVTPALPAAVRHLPALDPARLGPMAAKAEATLLRQGESENTLRSYRSALRYWAAWYALLEGRRVDATDGEPDIFPPFRYAVAGDTQHGSVETYPGRVLLPDRLWHRPWERAVEPTRAATGN